MIKTIKKLILVDVETFEKSGAKNWKYSFLNPDNTLTYGYDQTGAYADRVVDSNGQYSEFQASEFVFTPKTFNGVTKMKLCPPDEKKRK